jgi:RHS repeat-associated protein
VAANVAITPVLLMVHADHLKRPIRMTDASKATVWQAVWKPFAEPYSLTGTQSLDARFPGQWFQIETGLAYNWHRHYDATTGRYTQPDPLKFLDGPSVYAYVGGSPMIGTDKTGLYGSQELPHSSPPGTSANDLQFCDLKSKRQECIDECRHLLEGHPPWSDIGFWDFHKCINKCMGYE